MSRSQDSGDRGSQKARGRNATKVTDEKVSFLNLQDVAVRETQLWS